MVTAKTPCAHCGQAVGAYPILYESNAFCCTGCEVVYDALHQSGLDAMYYKLRESSGVIAKPIQAESTQALQLAALDAEDFLREHTHLHEDGSRSTTLFLEGLQCTACVWLIEQMPKTRYGIIEARVDLMRNQLKVHWQPSTCQLSQVAQWLSQFGYTVQPSKQASLDQRSSAEKRLLIRMGISWALAGNVMLLAFTFYSGLSLANQTELAVAGRWLSLILATGSLFSGGVVFFRTAWASIQIALKTRSLNRLHMDVPISLGVLIGYGYSVYATITSTGEVWFDSITVLMAALLTARWLHLRSTRIAQDASDQLLALIPTMARKIMGKWTGEENQPFEVVSANILETGDIVVVYAGEVFPVDGIVVRGETSVNNAVLTGESLPIPTAVGDRIQAGATNISQPVHVAVQATGDQTRIGKLIAWVREGTEKHADIVQWADKIGGWFVLAIFVLAIMTTLLWWPKGMDAVVHNLVALLVITCPCALGMATPLAMAMASGKAARAGIYLKHTATLQQLEAVDTIVVDKTGTLTEGQMNLLHTFGDAIALQRAALLESHSNHPIAQAFLRHFTEVPALLRREPNAVQKVQVASNGITGWVQGHPVLVGRPDWVAAAIGRMPKDFETQLARFLAEGASPVAIAQDGRWAGLVAVGDALRAGTAELLASWAAKGKAVYVLSGDHPDVVQRVSVALGIVEGHVFGHQTPEMKQAFIEQKQKEGHKVAMLGDGVNDAAALRAANVGIAVQGSTTASMVAADVFVTKPGLAVVVNLFHSAHKALNVIKRNLVFSLLYNAFGAVAAMLGWVDPLVAAVAMPLSSLVVVGSSVLQRTFVSQDSPAFVGGY